MTTNRWHRNLAKVFFLNGTFSEGGKIRWKKFFFLPSCALRLAKLVYKQKAFVQYCKMVAVQYDSGKVVIIYYGLCALLFFLFRLTRVSEHVMPEKGTRRRNARSRDSCDELATIHETNVIECSWSYFRRSWRESQRTNIVRWRWTNERTKQNYLCAKKTIQKPFSQTKLWSFPLFFQIKCTKERHATYFTTHQNFFPSLYFSSLSLNLSLCACSSCDGPNLLVSK